MGIPAYYKKLSSTVKGLITHGHPCAAIQWLFMDFNCLVYHCLPKMPTYQTMDHAAWEAELIQMVVRYTKRVVHEVAPEKGVMIAVDGVVPMAKMRQQRLRRFKAVWEKAHPAAPHAAPHAAPTTHVSAAAGGTAREAGVLGTFSKSPKSPWNTSAITPGTAFMDKLRHGLEAVKEGWIISSSDEPGEGEHKIMAAWRTGNYEGNVAVYGLDADLVVLSLLGREQRKGCVWLFREQVNGGGIQYDEHGNERFEWFSIDALATWLEPQTSIYDYCFAMSVLGNDFLPSSLGMKMRDEGHRALLELLRDTPHLIDPITLEISHEGLTWFFQRLARMEERQIRGALLRKERMASAAQGRVIRLGDSDWPLVAMEEQCLIEDGRLAQDWRRRYAREFFGGHSLGRIASEYLYGIQWIWAYYTGREVCYNWYFPHSLPPLWGWIAQELGKGMPAYPGTIVLRAADIRPVEQLALVLPWESWDLIPAGLERDFVRRAPQYFPTTYGFDSVGKRFFWECEPRIPMPSMAELKRILRRSF